MTGQVKEEILTRHGELGVRIQEGRLQFQPVLLRRREFLTETTEFLYFDVAGDERRATLSIGSLAFTLCQVLVVHQLTDGPFSIDVSIADGATTSVQQGQLNVDLSRKLFLRTGEIERIDVHIPETQIHRD